MELQQIIPGTVKQGYLTKSPPLDKGGLKSWKKRFCILYRSGAELYLQYYENYEAALTSLPKDVVALQGCLGISKDLNHRSHKHLFSIQLPHRTYYFSASSEPDMRDWVDIFCRELGFSKPEERQHCKVPNPFSTLERPLPPIPSGDLTSASLPSAHITPSYNTGRPLPPIPPPRDVRFPSDRRQSSVDKDSPVHRRQQMPPPLPPRVL